MHKLQMFRRMCDNSVNKVIHALAAILLVRLVGQPPKMSKMRFSCTSVLPFISRFHI